MTSDSTTHNLLSINNDLLVFKRLVMTMKNIRVTAESALPLVDAPAHYDNSQAFAYLDGHNAGVAQTINTLLEIASKATPNITGEDSEGVTNSGRYLATLTPIDPLERVLISELLKSAYMEGFETAALGSEIQPEALESWWQNSRTRRSLK